MKIRYLLLTTFLVLILGCGGGFRGGSYARDSYCYSLPVSATPTTDGSVNFDVPIHVNKEVKNYLIYFSTQRKKVMQRWLARAPHYLPMIKGVFQEYGLPDDLAYLAMIESGFNPSAWSSAGAVGMWQFIKGTGRRYGLVIDRYVDERLDPEKSTRAAARYLLDLYKRFGSWYLAAASYNCGEMRVQRELGKSSNRNFWELSVNKCLPNETKNYVPQMIAAMIIAKNPEEFGFTNLPVPLDLPRDYREEMEPASELIQTGGVGTALRPQPRSSYRVLTPMPLKEPVSPPVASTPKPRPEAKVYAKFAKKWNHQVQVAEKEKKDASYTASMLGTSHEQQSAKGPNGQKPRNQQVSAIEKKKKATQINAASKTKAHAGKKQKYPPLAKSAKNNETKTAKAHYGKRNSSASHSKEKLAKPKTKLKIKPIVVSESG